MQAIVAKAVVLARTNFQEADRIVTLLTPDHGKVRAIAKGVRRPKSKLAGGIELFCVSDITFLPSRSGLSTLISTRLLKNYANIVSDINRTMFGYELLKRINKVTEDAAEPGYFTLLTDALEGLNNFELSLELVELGFTMKLLQLAGYAPNLLTDASGNKLEENKKYAFDFDNMVFVPSQGGKKSAPLIKILRLGLGVHVAKLAQVQGTEGQVSAALQLARTMLKYHLSL